MSRTKEIALRALVKVYARLDHPRMLDAQARLDKVVAERTAQKDLFKVEEDLGGSDGNTRKHLVRR